MGKQTPVDQALGLGQVITFSDGTQLPCVPATLADLNNVMGYWSTWVGANLTIQGLYIPSNEKARDAFEQLLHIACRRTFAVEELRAKISVADGGEGVINYLNRFLGFKPRDAGTEAKEQED